MLDRSNLDNCFQAVTLHTTLGDMKLEIYCESVRRPLSSVVTDFIETKLRDLCSS